VDHADKSGLVGRGRGPVSVEDIDGESCDW